MIAQFESIVAVARYGSLRAAAAALYLSEPALSRRIKALETQLGCTLFIRTHRGIRVTDDGLRLLAAAERALRAVADVGAVASDLRLGVGHVLTVGATAGIGASLLPPSLSEVKDRYPALNLSVRIARSEEIVSWVRSGEVALGLMRELRQPDLHETELYIEHVMFVSSPDHPAAGVRLDAKTLANFTLITADRTSQQHQRTMAVLAQAGVVAPRTIIEGDNAPTVARLAAAGLGIGVLASMSALPEIAAGSLVELRVAGIPRIDRRFVAVRRQNAGPPGLAETSLVEAIRALAKRLVTDSASVIVETTRRSARKTATRSRGRVATARTPDRRGADRRA